jgi:hypothetical protein
MEPEMDAKLGQLRKFGNEFRSTAVYFHKSIERW